MKTIGLLGGMSWESSAVYYRLVNCAIRDRLGPEVSARCLMWSFDFSEIAALQREGRWDELSARLIDAAQRLESAGADMVLICTNTMHRMADEVQAALTIPLVHIADTVGEAIRARGFTRVGLLGTAFTMEQDFFKDRLRERFGLDVLVPEAADRADVHRIIYDELCAGVVSDRSRAIYRGVMSRLVEHGAQAIILGCTEIMLLVRDSDSAVPLFDTTRHHAETAARLALEP